VGDSARWTRVRTTLEELRQAIANYSVALEVERTLSLAYDAGAIAGPPTQAAQRPSAESFRMEIARFWGKIREDIIELGVPLYWETAGRTFPTFEIISTPPDPRAPSVLIDSLRFARAALDVADGMITRRLEQHEREPQSPPIRAPAQQSKRIFVVHGRDVALREAVARFIEKLDLEAVILQEAPNKGRTLVEKLEDEGDVAFAVVLLTPDDTGGPMPAAGAEQSLRPRARQNVILELGYFMAALSRARVAALYAGGVELPSDVHGVAYISTENAEWKLLLAKELKAAGLAVDLNKISG